MNDEELKLIQDKIYFYYKEKQAIHVELKNNQFYNGFIQTFSADFFMIQEMMLGVMPIFYKEINIIEPYVKRKEEESNGM